LVSAVVPPSEEKAGEFGVTAEKGKSMPNAQQLAEIKRLIDEGKLKTRVSTFMPLSEAKAALKLSESGRTRGKTVLRVEASL
jgi:NADPH:quinone reductase-like Zn-dependent oxidoreductase